jgi:hypothetical protein
MKKITQFIFLPFLLSMLMLSCKKDLLDVPNENNPDFKKVYAKGDDVQNVAAGLFNAIYKGEHASEGVEMMLAVASDNITCSHGNSGMWHMSSEPRNLAWDNSPSYANSTQTKYTYDQLYSGISTAALVIKAINDGLKIGDAGIGNNRVLAVARFIQGISYGNLALVYDRVHIVDEAKTVEGKIEAASTYKDAAAAAVAYLDKAIELSNTSFTIPASWFASPTDISNVEFKKMCNTMAAIILS